MKFKCYRQLEHSDCTDYDTDFAFPAANHYLCTINHLPPCLSTS